MLVEWCMTQVASEYQFIIPLQAKRVGRKKFFMKKCSSTSSSVPPKGTVFNSLGRAYWFWFDRASVFPLQTPPTPHHHAPPPMHPPRHRHICSPACLSPKPQSDPPTNKHWLHRILLLGCKIYGCNNRLVFRCRLFWSPLNCFSKSILSIKSNIEQKYCFRNCLETPYRNWH